MMKRNNPINIILEITVDIIREVRYWFDNNIRNLPTLLNIILPYLMYFLGVKIKIRHLYLVLLIPVIVYLISYYSKSYANKINKGSAIPVPSKRFTQEDEFGEVSIDQDRLSELILYMADLEDFLSRKGLL